MLALHPVAHEGVQCIVIDPSLKQKQWREDRALVLVGPTAASLPQHWLPFFFLCPVLCLLSRPPVDTDRAKLLFFVDLGWFQLFLVYLRVMRRNYSVSPSGISMQILNNIEGTHRQERDAQRWVHRRGKPSTCSHRPPALSTLA